jgi:hypothetical protein
MTALGTYGRAISSGDNPTCGSQIARLEPFAEYRSIRKDVIANPAMADVVEGTLDIPLKNPRR